jgi:hypothetical protein
MNRKYPLYIMIVSIAVIGLMFFINKEDKNGKVNMESIPEKTYEQGLWDGFNRTIKYLDKTGYMKDTLRIEITELDSMLHVKQ